MKRKQTTALILAALITASMAGCQTETAQTVTEQTAVTAEETVETEKPERKPIPEGGRTYETLSDCVWIDGKYVSFPLDVSDFSSDFTFEPFYTGDDGTIIDTNISYKGKSVAFDFSH